MKLAGGSIAMMDNRSMAYVAHQPKYELPLEEIEPPCMRFSVNLWKNDPLDWVELICLLPNGFLLGLRVNPATTIQMVKAEMVNQAKQMPLSYSPVT